MHYLDTNILIYSVAFGNRRGNFKVNLAGYLWTNLNVFDIY